jgi:hypothetical protein
MKWWSSASKNARRLIFAGGLVAAVVVAVLGWNFGLTNEPYLVDWFLRIYLIVAQVYGALALILAAVKAYLIWEAPDTKEGIKTEDATLGGPVVGAVLDGFIILSQFGIATFLLALAGEGRLGAITSFDQYGLFGLAAFLYYSSGRGVVRIVRYLDTHLLGPEEVPAAAMDKAKGARPVPHPETNPPLAIAPPQPVAPPPTIGQPPSSV